MLKRWQEITDDYSLEVNPDKLITLTDHQKEAIKLQEKEILAYLYREVQTDRHDWLSSTHAQSILETAEIEPYRGLERWQNISDDRSFEPSIPEILMTEEQKAIKYSILAYLKENMADAHKEGINENTQQEILKAAETHPDRGLKEWQLLTQNYAFNPYADRMASRDLKINEYLQGILAEEGPYLSQRIKGEIVADLHRSPLKAYDTWQLHSQDKAFDVKTGTPTIELQAQNLIDSMKMPVPREQMQAWQEQVGDNPAAVIKQCQEFIRGWKTQVSLQKNASQFVRLSELREELKWNDPQLKDIDAKLDKITDQYVHDKDFIKEVEQSKSQAATERLAIEIRDRERTLSRNMGSYEMGM